MTASLAAGTSSHHVGGRASTAVDSAESVELRALGSLREGWWAVTDSNRRHPACKAGALPTELTALASPLSPAPGGEARVRFCDGRRASAEHRRDHCRSRMMLTVRLFRPDQTPQMAAPSVGTATTRARCLCRRSASGRSTLGIPDCALGRTETALQPIPSRTCMRPAWSSRSSCCRRRGRSWSSG